MFQKENVRGDIFGGITAGVVAIPLALAFGVQAFGVEGAIYGLYGAFALGIVAALFGGTPSQISGPTGPMTVVSALVVAAAVKQFGGVEAGLPLIIASFLCAGALQVLMGLAGLGILIRYIPYPVLSGFMSGIGVIIILLQIFPLLGKDTPEGGTLGVVTNIGSLFSGIDPAAMGVGLATIAVIYLFPKLTRTVPSSLVALVALTASAFFLKLDIPKIGEVPEGLPKILLGKLGALGGENVVAVLKFGAMLAALGAIDSLLTSVVADNITRTRHRPNKELIGQGLGNMVSACIGGLPGAGATMRTVVNVNAGGRTPLSGVIHGVLLFALVIGAGPLAAEIPLSVLAGILITVGIGIIDYKGIRQFARVPKSDAAVLVLVLLLTVFWNLLFAVGIGVAVAAALFVLWSRRVGKAEPVGDEPQELAGERTRVERIEGPLYFGSVFAFKARFIAMEDVDRVEIIMVDVTLIDQSGVYALEEVLADVREKEIEVSVVGLREEVCGQLERMGIAVR